MIGYNVKQANDLMSAIAKAYNDLEIYLPEAWDSLLYVVQGNWIGEDEQDFEKKLAERICNLNLQTGELAKSAINTIAGLAQAWREFQQKNTISGEVVTGDTKFDIDIPQIKVEPKVVSANIKTIANNANRGLQNESSGTTIKEKVTSFVGSVKQKTTGLFEAIEVNSAFFGSQTATIKSYIENVGSAIGDVASAVQDMFNELDRLVVSSYSGAMDSIQTQLETANSNVESTVSDLGNARWNSN